MTTVAPQTAQDLRLNNLVVNSHLTVERVTVHTLVVEVSLTSPETEAIELALDELNHQIEVLEALVAYETSQLSLLETSVNNNTNTLASLTVQNTTNANNITALDLQADTNAAEIITLENLLVDVQNGLLTFETVASTTISTDTEISFISGYSTDIYTLEDGKEGNSKTIIFLPPGDVQITTNRGTVRLNSTFPLVRMVQVGDHWEVWNGAHNTTYTWYPTTVQSSLSPSPGSYLRFVISTDGDTVALGSNTSTGFAAIYVRTNGSTWTKQGSNLTGTGNVGDAQWGPVALSADGNTLALGGETDDTSTGAVWIFTRTAGVWSQQGSKLVGTGATGSAAQGGSVALSADGDTLAFGGGSDDSGIGAAWIFTRSAGVWTQQGSKLVGTGNVGNSAQGSKAIVLSADGNTVAWGGFADDTNTGAVWVFIRSAGVWTQQGSKLVGSTASTSLFGESVSISANGNTLVAGGSEDDTGVGACWVFVRSGTDWSQQGDKLIGSGAVGSARQGTSVSITSDGNLIGSGGPDDDSNAGACWLFGRTNGLWTQVGSKLVSAGNVGDGCSFAGNGNTLLTAKQSSAIVWV